MKYDLKKRPKNPTIIDGFPGFGLVGSISTEFLMDHLDTEQIGKIRMKSMAAMVAVHKGDVIEPIGIFHNKKYNVVFIHAITGLSGLEWKIADMIHEIAKKLNAKEIISLEGIGSTKPSGKMKAFFYSTDKRKAKKMKESGAEELNEGIIMGTTGLLLLKANKVPVSTIFAETHSELPDSKAAAKVIEILDKYLGLKVDYKPLLKQAEKFEKKLKDILNQSQQAAQEQTKKQQKMSYIG